MPDINTLQRLLNGDHDGTDKLELKSCIHTGTIPSQILNLAHTLTRLDLSNNPTLSQLPTNFARLHNLKILFASNCSFTTFPHVLRRCRSLEMVAFRGNHMTEILPGSLPRKLRWLILTDNEIVELPADIGQCQSLQKCMLAGNKLRSLPDEMKACRKLGLLRLSANHFVTLPEWLFEMPELAFLSFAGNLFTQAPFDRASRIRCADESEFKGIQDKVLLGEGASGLIYSATWFPPAGTSPAEYPDGQKVAIKLFKSGLTSDGLPANEMDAAVVAGVHQNIVSALAEVWVAAPTPIPSRTIALVMPLIPSTYTTLGLSPTMDSCTRDHFPPGYFLSLAKIMSCLRGIAGAAEHLHGKRVAHGDLYAHNIQFNAKSGHALLGDFGAATDYEPDMSRTEKLEVLAFGHLIEDMMGVLQPAPAATVVDGVSKIEGVPEGLYWSAIECLNILWHRCSDPVVEQRPLFTQICRDLELVWLTRLETVHAL